MEHTVSPKLATYLVAKDVPSLVAFIEKGIGGTLSYRAEGPDGRVNHAEVRIADGLVMLGEAPEARDNFPAMLHLYVPDADVAYRRAVDAGAREVRAPVDSPDGHRRGGVKDAWGNEWWFSSPVRKR
jgi:PhnB protein